MSKPTVAVIGASTDRRKYGNKSVRAHGEMGYEVFPVNPRAGEIEGWTAYASLADVPARHLDRISVYVPPQIGVALLDEIAKKRAREVWFNPGSESPEIVRRASQLGIDIITACSIVNVGLSPAQIPDA